VHPASTIILDNEEVLGDETDDKVFASLILTKGLSSLSVNNQAVIFYVYFCIKMVGVSNDPTKVFCRTKLSQVGGEKRSPA